jgi:hypothetical protein
MDDDTGLTEKGPVAERVEVPAVDVLIHARRLSGQANLNAPSVLDKLPIPASEVLLHARRLSKNDDLLVASDSASPAGEGLVAIDMSPRASAAIALETATSTNSTQCVGRGASEASLPLRAQ